MLITIFVFSLFLAPWAFIQAVEDPIAAAGVFKYSEGTIAPSFIIEDLEGNRVRLKDFRGKVALITFWTTW
jgi:cytochrome oxidase Cu insertion factor (SCO1/SenC/PrrC family)